MKAWPWNRTPLTRVFLRRAVEGISGRLAMKTTFLTGAAALIVMFSSQAFAQSVAVEIDAAQRATIEDYIVT